MQNSKNTTYIQRGIVALRAPDGTFMQSVPLYENITPVLKKGEKQVIKDAADLFAEIIENFNKIKKENMRK